MSSDLGRLLDEASEVPQARREAPLAAIRRGAKRRRTVRLTSAGLAVVVALGVGWSVLPFRGGTPSLVGASPTPTPGTTSSASAAPQRTVLRGLTPPALPGGWTVLSYRPGLQENPPWQVLDRTRQKYVTIDEETVIVAPAGNRVAIVNLDKSRNKYQVTVRDLDGGPEHTTYEVLTINLVEWSPTGDRLLMTYDPEVKDAPRRNAYAIMDAVTGQVSRQVIDGPATSCDICYFRWSADGTKVMIGLKGPRADPADPSRLTVKGVQYYDVATGAPASTIDLSRLKVMDDPVLSPDGKAAVMRLQDKGKTFIAIVDLTTFEVHPIVSGQWVSDDRLVGSARPDNSGTLAALGRTGDVLQLVELPDFGPSVTQLGPK